MKNNTYLIWKKMKEYYSILLLLMMIIIASVCSPGYLSSRNVTNILQQIAPTGIAAVGMTLVTITGGFDMSIGAVMSLTGVLTMMSMKGGIPLAAAMMIGLLVGLLAGLLNGFLVAVVGINPFITTLATQTLIKGIALGITDTYPVTLWNDTFAQLSLGKMGLIPYSFFMVIVLAILYEFYLRKTKNGHYIFICGSNPDAGWSAGINITKVMIITYVICGVTASIGGLFLASKLGAGSPVVGGEAALTAMTAIIIGGNSLTGNKSNMGRTIIGILIIGVLNNMMNLMGTVSYIQTLLRGVIVIVVIGVEAEGVKRYIAQMKKVLTQKSHTA